METTSSRTEKKYLRQAQYVKLALVDSAENSKEFMDNLILYEICSDKNYLIVDL